MMLEEVAGHRRAEVLDRFQRMLPGQRVGDVLHRVRRDDQAVVADRVRVGEIPFELDLDRQLADLVAVGPAGDLRQPDPRLAVGMLGENDGHDRVPPRHAARWLSTRLDHNAGLERRGVACSTDAERTRRPAEPGPRGHS